ncbi:rod shape-determining protein RodA [Bacteroidota bacterium]
MRERYNILSKIDWITVGLYLLLVFLGWINIYSAVFNEDHQSIFDFSQSYGKQLVWIIAAVLLAIIIFLVDSKFYSLFAYVLYGISIILLIAVLIFGREIHGAKSWFQLGSFHFQPSEFAKITTCLAMAKYLSSYNLKIQSLKASIRILVIMFLPALLIAFQPDLGSTMVYIALILVAFREGFSELILVVGIILAILFILALLINQLLILMILMGLALLLFWILSRSFKKTLAGTILIMIPAGILFILVFKEVLHLNRYYIILLALAVAIPVFLIHAYRKRHRYIYLILVLLIGSAAFTFSVDYVFQNVLKEHQQQRVNILLGIESDPLGIGYNVAQSKIAIGSGGLRGKGFLQGTQTKFDFVPEQSTDFIFCTVGEEWGFMGTSLVILLFIFLMTRLIRLAERQRSDFSRIYGYGVVSILFFHFTVNIGMTIGLLPVIGIPLPFFSYGGSSLWAFTILLFVFLRLDASRMELLK